MNSNIILTTSEHGEDMEAFLIAISSSCYHGLEYPTHWPRADEIREYVVL